MSIVQSALERVKKDVAAPVPAAPPRARTAVAARWQTGTTALVDIERLRASRMYPAQAFTAHLQEEYRSLRREVTAASRQEIGDKKTPVGPIIVVTSALPGDGKSFTALNLALSIASEGSHDVLLIDGDTIKRTISTACGLQDAPGLIDLLARPEAGTLEHVCPTNISRLFVLPAGRRPPDAADLFSATRVAPLFDLVRSAMNGHFVVVDTPPILLSSETHVLADVAGQVLMVVRAGQTLRDSVHDALTRIGDSIPVGIVLNAWLPLLPSDKKAYSARNEYRA